MTVSDPRPGYLPTLDGWRAVSIIAVILHHDSLHAIGVLSTRWLFDYGYAGVDVFFAISGILICSRLLEEEKRTGSIGLKQFYLRRFLRICPPVFLYLLTICFLSRCSLIRVSRSELLQSLLFTRNYPSSFGASASHFGWYTAHFWSLSLEEQFYLFLPISLVLIPNRHRVKLLIALILAITLRRVALLHSHAWANIMFHADVRLDALFIPALFALLASNQRGRKWFQYNLRYWPLILIMALLMTPLFTGSALQVSLLNILMPCVVLGSVLNPANLFGRILEQPWLKYIGRISFSLYLGQQLFFTQHFYSVNVLGAWDCWPARALLTFGVASLSYHVVELPTSRLARRWKTS